MVFSKTLINWYQKNKRNLPWRETKNPYKIWLSEIMLQQTRVAQGLPYYLKFIEAFPTVFDLANASEDTVLKLWQGLGYYTRARNLHATAKEIAFNKKGVFPDTYKDLIKLKGVGDYTASAIASICFNEPKAVVDGNVYRVLARYFGVSIPINSTEGQKYFKALAQEVIDSKDPATYNQAIMEFGARQCTPKNPNCTDCVLKTSCKALADKMVNKLPVKQKKVKVTPRHFNYFVPVDSANKTILQQRKQKGIWYKLYEFPLVETVSTISLKEAQEHALQLNLNLNGAKIYQFNKEPIVHKLSHQHLHTTFWVVHLQKELANGILWQEIKSYAVPVLIANFIEDFGF